MQYAQNMVRIDVEIEGDEDVKRKRMDMVKKIIRGWSRCRPCT